MSGAAQLCIKIPKAHGYSLLQNYSDQFITTRAMQMHADTYEVLMQIKEFSSYLSVLSLTQRVSI